MKEPINRKDAIENIILQQGQDAIYITSTGLPSRDFYDVNKKGFNEKILHFPMMGSMGNALCIGLGLATTTNKRVVVIEGDSSALMGLSALAIKNQFNLPNLKYYILKNNQNASTGGQPNNANAVDFNAISECVVVDIKTGKSDSPRIDKPMSWFYENIKRILEKWNQLKLKFTNDSITWQSICLVHIMNKIKELSLWKNN